MKNEVEHRELLLFGLAHPKLYPLALNMEGSDPMNQHVII